MTKKFLTLKNEEEELKRHKNDLFAIGVAKGFTFEISLFCLLFLCTYILGVKFVRCEVYDMYLTTTYV